MNAFDSSIIGFVNRFSHRSLLFDKFILSLSDINLLKGGILIGILWWLWFGNQDEKQNEVTRESIINAFICCFISLFAARILALTLPFRLRPIHDPAVQFVIPYGMSISKLKDWSSFPSDHAVLFFTLAFSIYTISRKAGILSILYVSMIISFPRVFLGLHYPTDVLAGAVLGFVVVFLATFMNDRYRFTKPFISFLNRAPGFFYFCFFLLSFQVATLFNDSREIIEKIFKIFFHYL